MSSIRLTQFTRNRMEVNHRMLGIAIDILTKPNDLPPTGSNCGNCANHSISKHTIHCTTKQNKPVQKYNVCTFWKSSQ